MKLGTSDLASLASVAIAAAEEASGMIAATRPSKVDRKAESGSLASQVVTDVDRRSEEIILDALGPTLDRFELAVLTEERTDDGGRLTADHFWCIDPIDGTLPFVEGRPGYAVSIALVQSDGTPLIGVVVDPATSVVRHAIAGEGAYVDGMPLRIQSAGGGDSLSVFADRSLLAGADSDAIAAGVERVAHSLGLAGAEIHVGRGAVMNACEALDHAPGCYLKLPSPVGGGHLWDFAATALLYDEAGAVATDITGSRLDLNRADATAMGRRGVCYATDEPLAEKLRAMAAALASH